jgi:hypothetical protein
MTVNKTSTSLQPKISVFTGIVRKHPEHLFKVIQYNLEWSCIFSSRLSAINPIQNAVDILKFLTNITKLKKHMPNILTLIKDLSYQQLKELGISLKNMFTPVVKIFAILQKYKFFIIGEQILFRATVLSQGILLYATIGALIGVINHPLIMTELAKNLSDLTINIIMIITLTTGVVLVPHYVILVFLTSNLILSIHRDLKTQPAALSLPKTTNPAIKITPKKSIRSFYCRSDLQKAQNLIFKRFLIHSLKRSYA